MRKIGWFFIISSILAMVAEYFYLKFPTISWAFNMAYDNANLRTVFKTTSDAGVDSWTFAWFGYFVAVVGILLILIKGRDKDIPIPFGPYLAAAGWLALLWGHDITQAYLQFSGMK